MKRKSDTAEAVSLFLLKIVSGKSTTGCGYVEKALVVLVLPLWYNNIAEAKAINLIRRAVCLVIILKNTASFRV